MSQTQICFHSYTETNVSQTRNYDIFQVDQDFYILNKIINGWHVTICIENSRSYISR